jgi:hypothetical protein
MPRDNLYYDLINSRSNIFQAPKCWYKPDRHTAAWNAGNRFIASWRKSDKNLMANSGWMYIGEDKIVEYAIDAMKKASIHLTMTDEPYLYYGFEKVIDRELTTQEYGDNHEALVVYLPKYEFCDTEVKKKKVNYFVHPFAWLGRGKHLYVDENYKDYDKNEVKK